MQVWNSFCIAFAMYSRIPVPQADWEKKNMRYVMCCFPFVGICIGIAVCLAEKLLDWFSVGRSLCAVCFVLIPFALTGGIHMDGFLDTVDARHSYQSKERRLEILKDPHTGAFAIIASGCYLLLDYGIWTELSTEWFPVLAFTFGISRVLSAYAVLNWKNARGLGLAADFQNAAEKRVTNIVLIIEGILFFLGMLWYDWHAAIAAMFTAGICFFYYHDMAFRDFGGITGDLAGWFLQICELGMAGSIVIGDTVWF